MRIPHSLQFLLILRLENLSFSANGERVRKKKNQNRTGIGLFLDFGANEMITLRTNKTVETETGSPIRRELEWRENSIKGAHRSQSGSDCLEKGKGGKEKELEVKRRWLRHEREIL